MLYKMYRWHKCIATDVTFEELKALMLTLDSRPEYQEAVKNATRAYATVDDNDYHTALNWVAVRFDTIGSIKPMTIQ